MDLCFGVRSLQEVSVNFVPRNLFDFADGPASVCDLYSMWVSISCREICLIFLMDLLRCAISTVCECRFRAAKSVWFCWWTCASVCDLYREWVSISCREICLILLRNLLRCAISTGSECRFRAAKSVWFCWGTCFGVRSLQEVSVDFVPRNLFDFAEGPVLRCAISTVRECRFRVAKSVWFCWGTCASVCDLYRTWVSILCREICLILLMDLCFGVRFLQIVSVNSVPPNLFDFAEGPVLRCAIYSKWVSFEIPILAYLSHYICRSFVLHIIVPRCLTSSWLFPIYCFGPVGLQLVSLRLKLMYTPIVAHWSPTFLHF